MKIVDILVADDGKQWRNLCEETFSIAGYSCDFSESADRAIEKLGESQYKIVCVNLKLEDYQYGKALIRRIASFYPETQIIVITGYPAGTWPEAYQSFTMEIEKLKQRHANVQKVVLKGTTDEFGNEFIDKLLDEVEGLIGKPSPRSGISWLHLSDFHIRAESYEQDKVLKHLLNDLNQWSPDFIVVTGDIAFSAQLEEYQKAKSFLDKVLDVTHLKKDNLFLIPGNHDVDWTKLDRYREITTNDPGQVIEFMTGDEALNARNYVFSKFKNYARFINDYFGDVQKVNSRLFSSENYFYVDSIDIRNTKICVIGLNSSWASAFNFDFSRKCANDEKNLILGEPQVDSALERLEEIKSDIVIALSHHPFDWLKPFDRDAAEHPLHSSCSFILHGHLHESIVGRHIISGADVAILAAGTAYEKRNEQNRYSYIEVDLSTRKGLVYLRRYTPNKGGRWVADTASYPDSEDGVVEFIIPG
jgi:predicted MPP superfamily phosphohydrolase